MRSGYDAITSCLADIYLKPLHTSIVDIQRVLVIGMLYQGHVWMSIWQLIHTLATTEVSPDLGEFTEILDDVSVGMIPVRYR